NRAELPTIKQLVRSTFIALGTAIVLLITVILPAEYALDPTGMGRVLGLTEMGEIKAQLAQEAEEDQANSAVVAATKEVQNEPVKA
ncbi:transmembrane anchor protein, partial [Escherichia coli]|nr:transmembrane anchor protein [Escherichia coli]